MMRAFCAVFFLFPLVLTEAQQPWPDEDSKLKKLPVATGGALSVSGQPDLYLDDDIGSWDYPVQSKDIEKFLEYVQASSVIATTVPTQPSQDKMAAPRARATATSLVRGGGTKVPAVASSAPTEADVSSEGTLRQREVAVASNGYGKFTADNERHASLSAIPHPAESSNPELRITKLAHEAPAQMSAANEGLQDIFNLWNFPVIFGGFNSPAAMKSSPEGLPHVNETHLKFASISTNASLPMSNEAENVFKAWNFDLVFNSNLIGPITPGETSPYEARKKYLRTVKKISLAGFILSVICLIGGLFYALSFRDRSVYSPVASHTIYVHPCV